jgi:peptidoglycan/xylan/chitin deacetylase (PgdA/CDA1 family)
VDYVKGQRTLPEKSVVICFDDGYLSNTYYAAPILREFGYKATIFTIMSYYVYGTYQPNYYNESLQHFSTYDYEPNKDVLTVQCHTFNNHEHLPLQSYNTVYKDLQMCQDSSRTRFFAYPYGDFNDTVKKAVQDAGFEAAFTTVARNATVGEDLFEIPRHGITSPMSDDAFRRILTGSN